MRKPFSLFLIGLSICGPALSLDLSKQVPGYWIVTGTGADGYGAAVSIREFLSIGVSFEDASEIAMGDVFGGMRTSVGEGGWNQLSYFDDPNDIGFSFVAPVWSGVFVGIRKCIIRAHMNSATAFNGNIESDLYDSSGALVASVKGSIQGNRSSLMIDAFADASQLPAASP
jgi:hypothetical protein